MKIPAAKFIRQTSKGFTDTELNFPFRLQYDDCVYLKFGVAKWYPEKINGYTYTGRNKDYFTIPQNLLRVQDNGRNSPNPKCFPTTFIEYTSDQWFTTGDDLLADKVGLELAIVISYLHQIMMHKCCYNRDENFLFRFSQSE